MPSGRIRLRNSPEGQIWGNSKCLTLRVPAAAAAHEAVGHCFGYDEYVSKSYLGIDPSLTGPPRIWRRTRHLQSSALRPHRPRLLQGRVGWGIHYCPRFSLPGCFEGLLYQKALSKFSSIGCSTPPGLLFSTWFASSYSCAPGSLHAKEERGSSPGVPLPTLFFVAPLTLSSITLELLLFYHR